MLSSSGMAMAQGVVFEDDFETGTLDAWDNVHTGRYAVTNDPTHVDDILPAIKDLRDAWAEMKIADDDAQAQNLNRRVPAPSDAQRVSVMG